MAEISQAHWSRIDALLQLALDEDIGPGDVTTTALVGEGVSASASFVARQPGVLAGLSIVKRLFKILDESVKILPKKKDGEHLKRGEAIAEISGSARSILAGERTALNLLQRMCGIATQTHAYVQAVGDHPARILDTRKTLPGHRDLDKLAVFLGGGENHRRGLYDMILIKDNHITLGGPDRPAGSVAAAVASARSASTLPIMAEVDTLDQLREVVEMEPDYVLLDNMDPETLKTAVDLTYTLCTQRNLRRPQLEASGTMTLQRIPEVAATGVDRISVGALTHSVSALDIGLDFHHSPHNAGET